MKRGSQTHRSGRTHRSLKPKPPRRTVDDDNESELGYEVGAWRNDVDTLVEDTEEHLKTAHRTFYNNRLIGAQIKEHQRAGIGGFTVPQPKGFRGGMTGRKEFGCRPLFPQDESPGMGPTAADVDVFRDAQALRNKLQRNNQGSVSLTAAIQGRLPSAGMGMKRSPRKVPPIQAPYAERGTFQLATPPASFAQTMVLRRPPIPTPPPRHKMAGDYRVLQSPMKRPPPTGPMHRIQGNFRAGDTSELQVMGAETPPTTSERRRARHRHGATTERFPPGWTQVAQLLQPVRPPKSKPQQLQVRKDKLSRIEALLAQKMGTHFGALRTAFRTIDADRSGTISQQEFGRVFKMFNIHCSNQEITALWNKVDIDGSGELDYQEFIAQFGSLFSGPTEPTGKRDPILGFQ